MPLCAWFKGSFLTFRAPQTQSEPTTVKMVLEVNVNVFLILCCCFVVMSFWDRQENQIHTTQVLFFFFFHRPSLDFYYLKKLHYLFCFLTLCLRLQRFHNNFLLLNKKACLILSYTRGPVIGTADVLLRLRQSHKDFRPRSVNPSKSARAHTACRFRCFLNLPGAQVKNPVARSLRQSSFVRGCIIEEPTMACQTLDHSEYL